jgi:hypothetical protein
MMCVSLFLHPSSLLLDEIIFMKCGLELFNPNRLANTFLGKLGLHRPSFRYIAGSATITL